jgi:holo-[acyl-carrier protein] synthase
VLGVDVVDVARLSTSLERWPMLEERLFSQQESSYCRSFPEPAEHFAGTLAAKEAVIKALNLGSLVAWARRIEVSRDEHGSPSAAIQGEESRRVAISISHDGPVAVAVALDLAGVSGG